MAILKKLWKEMGKYYAIIEVDDREIIMGEGIEWYEYLDWTQFSMEHIQAIKDETAKKYALAYRSSEQTVKDDV